MDVTDTIELWLRGGLFLSLLVLFILAESLSPKRRRVFGRLKRWRTNFGITIVNTITIKLLGPVTAIATAGYASHYQLGFFNHIDLSIGIEFFLTLIVLDFAIYIQHVATHKIPVLWRLHKVHHSDRDIDTSTALRFHPIEIVLSMVYKCAVVLALGPAAFAVLTFEAILNGCAMFNHSNLHIPAWFDKYLRLFIVTPDMHRVHHSVRPEETNSNYGFSLSLWDRVFRTYKDQPMDGHDQMTIGLLEHQTHDPENIIWSLRLPFDANSAYIRRE